MKYFYGDKNMAFKRIFIIFLTVTLLFLTTACDTGGDGFNEPATDKAFTAEDFMAETTAESPPSVATEDSELPINGGYYYDLTNVVLYLELYEKLPPNFITKAEARKLGWSGGSVEEYIEGGAIGGDAFGNYEGLLPKANGRSYHECDIDTILSNGRGSKRLVFSDDGLYFYTSDHYESFSQVYVTEDFEVIW